MVARHRVSGANFRNCRLLHADPLLRCATSSGVLPGMWGTQMAKFCGQCGAPAGDQRFCGSCGAPLQAPRRRLPTGPCSRRRRAAIRPAMADDRRSARRWRTTAAPWLARSGRLPHRGADAGVAGTRPCPASAPPQQPREPAAAGGPAAALPAAAPPHAPHPGQQQQGRPDRAGAPGAAARPPRAVPLVNPFLGVPVADFVKDGAAALALLVALGQPWDWSSDANDHWWVVISLLLALVGLGVPYLMASRVVPTFTPQASLVTKLLLAAPLLVSTLVALVMDLTTIGDDSSLGAFGGYGGYEGGMGLAIALGLGGAALMAQPRRHEEATGLLAEQAWRTAGLAAAVAALVVSVATFVAGSIALADSGYVSGASFWTVWIASNLLLPTLFLALPLVALLRGSAGRAAHLRGARVGRGAGPAGRRARRHRCRHRVPGRGLGHPGRRRVAARPRRRPAAQPPERAAYAGRRGRGLARHGAGLPGHRRGTHARHRGGPAARHDDARDVPGRGHRAHPDVPRRRGRGRRRGIDGRQPRHARRRVGCRRRRDRPRRGDVGGRGQQ